MVWEEMSFEEFQDGHHDSHLRNQNRTISAILNVCVTVMPPIKFWINWTQFGRCRLKNGGHLGYQNGIILAILNLCVTVTPPIKYCLNPT